MGSGAVSKLPERLDREAVGKFVPAEASADLEAIFSQHADSEDTVSRDVLGARATALQELNEAGKLRSEGGEAEAVLARLQSAVDADPSFFKGIKIYADALSASGDYTQAVKCLLTFAEIDKSGHASEARAAAQILLVNAGMECMTKKKDVDGALESFSQAEALGSLPASVQAALAMAKFFKLRSAVMCQGSSDAASDLAKLRTELEQQVEILGKDGEELNKVLRQIAATEALTEGLAEIKQGHASAAAAKFEEAADGGEPGARCLAAEAYMKAALDEFSSFTSSRIRGKSASAAPDSSGPPMLIRAISDQGHGELAACATTASLARDTAAAAREDILELGDDGSPALERLAGVERMAEQLMGRIFVMQQMSDQIRWQDARSVADDPLDDPHLDEEGASDKPGDPSACSVADDQLDDPHLHKKGASDKAGDPSQDEPPSLEPKATATREPNEPTAEAKPTQPSADDLKRAELYAAVEATRAAMMSLKEAGSKLEEQVAAASQVETQLKENLSELLAARDAVGASVDAAADAAVPHARAAHSASARPHASEVEAGGEDPWHGLLGAGRGWSPPRVAAASSELARPGYDAYDATEFVDSPKVLKEKVTLLADLWKRSQDCVIYTGAGLSTSAGLGDYATKAKGSVVADEGSGSKTAGSRLELSPTLAHHGLAALGERGFIGHWVQQNHDRLSQKAGFPQAKINEIHGAWGDNKNVVKMMDDILRSDLVEWLQAWADRADMCVALGTSLCGMNADRIVRAVCGKFPESGQGLIIIGLQRTVYDCQASLRIWGMCDDVIKLVCKELGVPCPDRKVKKRGEEWIHNHPRLKYDTRKRTSRDPM